MKASIAHIEDNDGDAFILKAWAAENGYTLERFSGLDEFYGGGKKYDLIISDLNLSYDFGIDVPVSLAKNRPGEPFIILTGLASGYLTGDICKAYMDRGAKNVVPKEMVNSQNFCHIIEDALSKDGENQ